MTATIPGAQDQQLNLHATSSKEFRELLGQVREIAGLSGGQIAAKTGMPRSTAYSLPNANRPGLPSKEEQVRAYVQACGLSATQVDVVMDLWNRLHNEQANDKTLTRQNMGDKVAVGRSSTVIENHHYYTKPHELDRHDVVHDAGYAVVSPRRRKTTPLDLVHYILADEQRYTRALSLVKLLIVFAAVFVGGLVTIAVLVPSTAQFIGTGLLAAVFAAVAFGANGRFVATFSKKKAR